MKIHQLNIYRNSTPFAFKFKSSHVMRTESDSVLIELVLDNGISGWGECAARPYVTGETPESVVELARNTFREILGRAELASLADLEEILNDLELNCRRKQVPYLSALGGIDIALLDALGRFQNESVLQLLGGAVRNRIPYAISIPILPISALDAAIDIVRPLGCRFIKILMSADPEENRRRVEHIQRALGSDAELRIEANGIWNVQEAIENIRKLKSLGISAVEQPVDPRNLEGLREVRNKTGIPVVLDETICHFKDAERAIEAQACDMLNIKISKCGGLLRSRKIADFAAQRGIPCHLGAHVGETSILSRAGECFALTTPNITFYEGCSQFLLGFEFVAAEIDSTLPPVEGLGAKVRKGDLIPVFQDQY